MTSNPGKVVTQYQLSQLFSKAWMQSMTISNIVSGFRMTGIYPTDQHALLKLIPNSSPNPTRQESRLALFH